MTTTDAAASRAAERNSDRLLAAQGDLREFLRLAADLGELEVVEGADAHLEIGTLYELSLEHEFPPVLLFDRIVGYPQGYRVAVNVQNARVLREGRGLAAVEIVRRQRKHQVVPIPPTYVPTGPVFDNVLTGPDVNVLAFPCPQWHEEDGGRYVGTQVMIVNKDPDSDWVNAGTYRVQVHDRDVVTVFIEPGKQGRIIREKYWSRGEPCPMVVCLGQAPILSQLAGSASRHGESEFAVA